MRGLGALLVAPVADLQRGRRVNFFIDDQDDEAIHRAIAEDGVSISDLLRALIAMWRENEAQQREATKRARTIHAADVLRRYGRKEPRAS